MTKLGAADSFNPLYIGSRLPTNMAATPPWTCPVVSIPSTSGHVFQPMRDPAIALLAVPFQSPLHRVTSSNSANGCQGPERRLVSIPSTSGHVFQRMRDVAHGITRYRFQSPLHRVTSSNVFGSCSSATLCLVSIPSTSGHVFQHRDISDFD